MKPEMTVEEAVEEIKTKPTVPPWPTYGVAMGLSKGGSYDSVRRGDVETLRVGRLIKVITAPLRKKLGL